MILREDRCGIWWSLMLDWVIGKVQGENFWKLRWSDWLWFFGLVAKFDEYGRKRLTFEKVGKEQDECPSKFCRSLTYHLNIRISIRDRKFCSSLNCLKNGTRDSKKQTKYQLDATLWRFYFCRVTLHGSGVNRPSSGVLKNWHGGPWYMCYSRSSHHHIRDVHNMVMWCPTGKYNTCTSGHRANLWYSWWWALDARSM